MKYFNRIISAVLIIALVFCTYPESFFYVKANGSTSSNDISDNEISVYTVTFDSDGGSSIDSQEVEEGALIEKPSDPEKDGCVFDGWYHEDTPWDFDSSKVTSDITLTAMYKEKSSVSSNVLEVSPKDEGTESDPGKGAKSDPIFGTPKNMLRGPLRAPMANSSEGHELKVTIWLNTGKACTESVTQTFSITDEELSESFPEPRKGNQSEAFLDGKLSFPSEDGYVFSCANYHELKLQRNSDSKYQITVYAYYIIENETTLMPIDLDYTDYPRPKYPSVQNAVGSPCVNGAPVKFEWSDEPLNAENATEVQMPGSAHKIYGVYDEREENGETYHVFSLYTSASKVYLIEPEYGFSNIQYFDFSNFDMSNVFYRDRGDVWEENDNYNYEILFGDLVEVDLSGAYGLDDFCFPSMDPQESLEILNLGNAKWPRMATVLAWQDAAGATMWYYSDDNYPSLKVLDLRNVDFSDVPTVEKDGKQIIRCDYSILADGYTRYDEDNYEGGYPCWYHDEEDGLGEDGKPLPGDNAPKMVYIDDDEDGIAEGEVKWSMEMTVEDMKHRFVTADMATLPPEAKTIKVHYLSSSYSGVSEKIVPVDCYVRETITLSKNVKTNDFNRSFDGWYTPDGTKLNLNSYKVEEDLTDIYAMYEPCVTFDNVKTSNGRSTYYTFQDYNTPIDADEIPKAKERNGYEVTGWEYTNDVWYPTLGDTSTDPLPFDPTMPITRSMTIKPIYTKIGSSTPDPNPGPGYDTVTITLHEMVKEGDVYVEKSSQDCQFPEEMANGESQDTTDLPLAYLLTAFNYYGYNQTVYSPFVGISNSDDGPSGTVTLTPNDHLYLFFEGEPENDGSVAVLCSGPEFNKLLRQELDDSGQYMVERVNSVDEIDIDSATIVSTYYSPYPIYACADEDNEQLMRLYTEASTIELNEDSSYLFANVMVANMGLIDSSKVKNASFMFMRSYCKDIASSLDTSSVTNMTGMFMEYMAEDIDISSYDTSNVENMGLMFEGCELTKSINLSGINTSKVKNMAGMFYRDSALESLDLTSFDTSNVESMLGMFAGVEVDTLDLSSFNTSKVKNMDYMFYFSKFDTLDISGFTFDSITKDMPNFVYGFKTLKMGKVNPGRNIGFAEYMFYLDDNEDGQVDSPTAYGKAIDDNENHTYKLLIKINYFDDNMLYAEQYYSNPKKDMVKPEDPSKEGMKFVGWVIENGDLFNFDDINASYSVSPVINLYAKWVPTVVHTDECKITYWTQAGTKPDTVWVKKNQKIKPFDEPIYVIADVGVTDDFHFLGWCKEDGTFWDFDNDIVTEDTTLYAVFDVVLIEIEYLDNESFDNDYIAVPYGETISVDDIDPIGTHGNIRSVKYFGYYQNEHTAGSSSFSSSKTMAELEQELGSKLQTYNFDAPVICPLVLYVDCDRLKWRHMFFKECPDSYKKDMGDAKTYLEMISEDNLCCDVYLENGESFVPPVFDNTYSWNKYAITDGDKVYQKGEAIVGSNKHEYYYMEDIKNLPVTVDFEAVCTENGTQRQGSNIYASTAKVKYGDKIKSPSGDRADVIGTMTYKWVVVPTSKEEEARNALEEALEEAALNGNPSDINVAECIESLVSDGICDYYEFDDQALMDKYTISELTDEDNHRLKITLFQIPAAVNYKLTIPDEISANDHSFQVSFDCGNHFCNDVTVTFDPSEVFLPNTGYTVSLYEDASFDRPLTSLTFKEKGSKTVYIKAEPEDGAARVGQDSVEIAFEISDLGYDEEVEAANN